MSVSPSATGIKSKANKIRFDYRIFEAERALKHVWTLLALCRHSRLTAVSVHCGGWRVISWEFQYASPTLRYFCSCYCDVVVIILMATSELFLYVVRIHIEKLYEMWKQRVKKHQNNCQNVKIWSMIVTYVQDAFLFESRPFSIPFQHSNRRASPIDDSREEVYRHVTHQNQWPSP